MAPFATGTWSVVGNTGINAPGSKSPHNVAYDPALDVLCVGGTGDGPIFPFNPNSIARSTDHGATWSIVLDPTQVSEGGGGPPFHAPVALSRLRDATGAALFVAAIVRETFVGVTSRALRITIWTSATGQAWAPGQVLVDLPDPGFGSVSFAVSSFATRPAAGPGGLTEHYIYLRGLTGAAETRGLFRSTDLGLTWTFVSDPGAVSIAVGGPTLLGLPNRTLVISALPFALASTGRSEDGGLTWQPASPEFACSSLAAFGGGPMVGCAAGTLGSPEITKVSCDDARSWPVLQQGPSFGLGSASAVGFPVILPLNPGTWEVLMAAAANPLGTLEIVYSNNGGETAAETALVTESGTITHLSGAAKLADGRPIFVCGVSGNVLRSSDVPTGQFGQRIYCVTAPAPGVGIAGFPDPCGDFYNPCPQECPVDPVQPAGLVVAIPAPVVLGDSWPFGDEELTYGDDQAIYGGDPNAFFSFPVLGLPAGCGATFINQPCASEACPV